MSTIESHSAELGRGRAWLAVAALTGLTAVAIGAAASHLLGGLPDDRAGWIETALRYQMLHAAALLAVAILSTGRGARLLDLAGLAFVGGLLVFSGLLYAMGLGAPRWLGAVVPLGGLSYMAGWGALLLHALRGPRPAARSGPAESGPAGAGR